MAVCRHARVRSGAIAGLRARPANGLLARADGSVDLLFSDVAAGSALLARLRPDGSPDPSFRGGAGVVRVPDGSLVAGLAGSVLVTTTDSPSPAPGEPFSVTVRRLLADGTPDPLYGGASGRRFTLPFGGGNGTTGLPRTLRRIATLNQTGFRGGAIAARPGGGFVVAGAAAVIQYTGEGEGIEHEDVALAAFGADLAPDPSLGGPAVAPRMTFSVPRQRAATAALPRRRYVLARLAVSTPSLCQISIRARGAVVAKVNVPAFTASGQTARVWLTKAGRKLLPRARRARATARATCQDLVGSRTTVTATALLR